MKTQFSTRLIGWITILGYTTVCALLLYGIH
jgi:hypothetical protein